jgi:procollagen-lysine,2-oxoglutarate 5-dioxygenase
MPAKLILTFYKLSIFSFKGTNTDQRLQGGYEAVPTRDIHMNQVGLENVWLKFLKDYVRPLQEKVFLGYFHDVSLFSRLIRYF